MVPTRQISNIIDYMWKDEEKHYREQLFDRESRGDHIFHDLLVVRVWLEKIENELLG